MKTPKKIKTEFFFQILAVSNFPSSLLEYILNFPHYMHMQSHRTRWPVCKAQISTHLSVLGVNS